MSGPYFYTPYIWPMLVSAIFSAALGVYAWRHRTVPGAAAFAVQELFIALWALLTAMEMAATAPVKILHHKLEAAAALTAMSAMLYFAFEYTNSGKWATRRNALLLSLVTLGIMLLMATNDLHHLVWTRLWFDRVVRVERGSLNPLLLAWAILLPTLSVLLFLRLFLRSRGIYRQQALMLCIGAALPLLTFFLEPAGINPLAPLDPVILVWNVSSLLYALAIFRFRMLEIVPIGRDTAIERMANGVLVLDAENRIVDLNPAAGEVLILSRGATVGRPAGQVLAAYPDLSRFLEQKTAASTEITLYEASQPRYFQVQVSPLTHPGGFHLGRLLLLQDVTEQRRARALLLEQQTAVAVLREREQMARELHDGLGQVLGYVKMQAQAARSLLAQERKAEADSHLEQLVSVTQDAHADMRDFIFQASTASLIELGFRASLQQYLQHFSQNHEIRTELDMPPEMTDERFEPAAAVQLLRIIQEALTNARKHAHASQVRVSLAARDDTAEITIADDGSGFDPDQAESDGFGLRFMAERARAVGGSLRVRSTPGQGTQVVVQVPLRKDGGP